MSIFHHVLYHWSIDAFHSTDSKLPHRIEFRYWMKHSREVLLQVSHSKKCYWKEQQQSKINWYSHLIDSIPGERTIHRLYLVQVLEVRLRKTKRLRQRPAYHLASKRPVKKQYLTTFESRSMNRNFSTLGKHLALRGLAIDYQSARLMFDKSTMKGSKYVGHRSERCPTSATLTVLSRARSKSSYLPPTDCRLIGMFPSLSPGKISGIRYINYSPV